MNENIKLLIISNNALQLSNSNGRTLIKLLNNVSKNNIAQFCLSGIPDFNFCDKCFILTDNDALDAIFSRKKFINKSFIKNQTSFEINVLKNKKTSKKITRNCRNMVIRNLIWKTYFWWTKELDFFIKSFAPNVILFQAGDAPFMIDITLKISKKFNLPIIVFNSENFVLKKYMYSSIKKQNFWHLILHKSLKTKYKKLVKKAKSFVYSTEYLKEEFDKKYNSNSFVIYTSSNMNKLIPIKHDGFIISYIGNLGVGRYLALAEIAEVLDKFFPMMKLQIFGKFENDEEKQYVCKFSSVIYKGLISYEEIPFQMQKSDLLLHCESSERIENLKGAFSTKIADSLSCGIPFLVYASREYPFVKYLIKNDAALIASNQNELIETLSLCLKDKNFLNQKVSNALNTALKYHNESKNSNLMFKLLLNAINK